MLVHLDSCMCDICVTHKQLLKGGPNSGNHGHAGRPGLRGGSASKGGGGSGASDAHGGADANSGGTGAANNLNDTDDPEVFDKVQMIDPAYADMTRITAAERDALMSIRANSTQADWDRMISDPKSNSGLEESALDGLARYPNKIKSVQEGKAVLGWYEKQIPSTFQSARNVVREVKNSADSVDDISEFISSSLATGKILKE